MELQVLSHAGLRVSAGGTELLCDPWLVGSTYWRSWWNYPPVPRALVDSVKPNFIYLTHIHWDHFQAASLRLFASDTPVFVPYHRHGRMVQDLKAIGMTKVREIRHGERLALAPGLAIRAYQFSPFVTDSAVVIEAEEQILLNANDAKLAGLPLRQILSKYPRIDFCFRSHTSANARACFHYLDAPDERVDDNERYLRVFALFMDRVQPRYAIPFASNSCLLHDDVYAMNGLTQTPLEVRHYFERYAAERGLDTELRIMIPGDRWSSEHGFRLAIHNYFTNRDAHLAAYRDRVRPALDDQAKLEARVQVSLREMATFFALLSRQVPGLLLRPLKGRNVLIVARSEAATSGFVVDLVAGRVKAVAPEHFGNFDMRIEFPALILRQALSMNMFSHAGISKRVRYYATKAAMPTLRRFVALIDGSEAELFPLRAHLRRRSIQALLPRWREGILYLQAVVDVLRGAELPAIEEKYLERRGARRPGTIAPSRRRIASADARGGAGKR